MSRKLFTALFVVAIVFVSATPILTTAAAMSLPWKGFFAAYDADGYPWLGLGSYDLTGADGPNPVLSFNAASESCQSEGELKTIASVSGPITVSYDLSISGSIYRVFMKVVEYDPGTGTWSEVVLVDDWLEPAGDVHYAGTLDLVLEEGLQYTFYFYYWSIECGSSEGALQVGMGELAPYQPAIKYNMWLLTRNDGTYCLLKSETHPSVAAQKAFCFPEETGGTWVADNVLCAGPVDENDFWVCAAEYINLREGKK